MFRTTVRDGHVLCTEFISLPDPNLFPDYYATIKAPISMAGIHERLYHGGFYHSLSDVSFAHAFSLRLAKAYCLEAPRSSSLLPLQFVSDVKRMFRNARTYNEPGSPIYEASVVLQQAFIEQLNQVQSLPVGYGRQALTLLLQLCQARNVTSEFSYTLADFEAELQEHQAEVSHLGFSVQDGFLTSCASR